MARLYGPGSEPPPPLVATSDLAGLSTRDVEGSPVGELVGTLSEDRTGLIRYLDISIRGGDKHVLVPIGHARIEGDSVPPRVRLRAATHEDLLRVPAYQGEQTQVDGHYQDEVMQAHGQLFYGSRYYAHPAYDHSKLYAGEHPVITESPAAEGGLRPLSEMPDHRLPRGAPGLVGWTLTDGGDETVGTVEELLVDVAAGQVRYVVIALERPARLTLLPIGYIEAGAGDEQALAPALTVEDIRLLPPYEPPVTREEENRLHAAIEGRLSGERYFERADFRSNGLTSR